MSYSRVMPNIKPYPHQDNLYDMSYQPRQPQPHYSVYRPAYHRIPSTPALAPRQASKEVWGSMSPEVSPIVVPSMSAIDFYPVAYGYSNGYYRQPMIQSTNYHHMPIHHTLENATITYDTVTPDFQKDLVKDVFFSPAMIREMSPESISSDISESDFGTSSVSSTPSEVLMLDADVPLFDFGLDLATGHHTSSYEEVVMAAKKKPGFSLKHPFDYEASEFSMLSNKRRCSDSVLQDRLHKKKKQRHVEQLRTFHQQASPLRLKPEVFENTYFDEASGEESEDDNESIKRSSLENNDLTTAFQSNLNTLSDEEDDSFSTTSWEEELVSDGETSEEDEEFKEPLKYSTKKYKKLSQSAVHPLCHEKKEETCVLPKTEARPTATPTIYQKLTKASIDWCRYCGTTEGVNWRPGPWGKRTLCNKHGCDYKGYGFACKLPRLDLTGFTRESIDDRERPVLQLYCSGCQGKESWEGNVLVRCEGCPKAFHQQCCPTELTDAFVKSKESWFCDASCCENTRRKRIVVELPRKRLPLMCAPKSNSVTSECRGRSLRESSVSSLR